MFRVGEQCWKQFPHSSVVFDEGGVFCVRIPSPCPSHWSPCYDFILQQTMIISVWEKGSEEAAKRMSLILLAPLIQWGVPSFLMFWVDAKSHKEHQRVIHLTSWEKETPLTPWLLHQFAHQDSAFNVCVLPEWRNRCCMTAPLRTKQKKQSRGCSIQTVRQWAF